MGRARNSGGDDLKATLLVLGGVGHIGSHLVRQLIETAWNWLSALKIGAFATQHEKGTCLGRA